MYVDVEGCRFTWHTDGRVLNPAYDGMVSILDYFFIDHQLLLMLNNYKCTNLSWLGVYFSYKAKFHYYTRFSAGLGFCRQIPVSARHGVETSLNRIKPVKTESNAAMSASYEDYY